MVQRADVVVVGAGQAGLSAGYHLLRFGFADARSARGAHGRSFIMLDAEAGPGGAWQHRWPSLTMATVNHIFDLPGLRQPAVDPASPSREAVPAYFAAFESTNALPILRPARVRSIARVDDDPEGPLRIETATGAGTETVTAAWNASAVINATGTWGNPVRPHYPGEHTFLGRQLHTKEYVSLEAFAGLRVAVVGAGISAVQQLEEISRVASVAWYTRREPEFLDGDFTPEVEGRETIARVAADAAAGNAPRSVVSYTRLPWTPYARAAERRGALQRRPMFTGIEPHGVREADGSFTSLDVILWATGFRPALAHLAPLELMNERGGIEMDGTRVVREPRVHLIGYGASQSTVGANRAGREAVVDIVRRLEGARESA